MSHIKFSLLYLALVLTTITLSIHLFHLTQHHSHLFPLFLVQCAHLVNGYLFLGMGFGFPLVMLASILGWGQMILLMNGNIAPHLSKKGFVNVLQILFSKL